MPEIDGIAAHYSSDGLLDGIRAGIAAIGKDSSTVTIDDLAPVDEFHIGGREATAELCRHLSIDRDTRVLDIGCGIGGTARFLAATFGAHVTGVDLTPEYVEAATALSEAAGLASQVRFEAGSALEMPFADDSFDVATQLHVGMNIDDKATLFEQVFRVLRPGARFGVYDIMRESQAAVDFPVPWASDASMSFVDEPAVYREGMEAAGFVITHERSRREFALEFFAALRARSAGSAGPPALGLHLLMGPEASTKFANMVAALEDGALAPIEIVGLKPAE